MDFPLDFPDRCAACRYLRKSCPRSDCIFSRYFPPNNPQRYAVVHRIYGAKNVGRMLKEVEPHLRADAADSLFYEAECRLQDPVYGCTGIISRLVEHIHEAECELAITRADIVIKSEIGQQAL